MKKLSIPGFISISKLVIKLLINSFLLGPLAIIYALIAEALLATDRSVLFDETSSAIMAIIFGGFFCSFACMAASMLILLPIALWEFNQKEGAKNNMTIFQKYLSIPALLSIMLALMAWVASEFEPLPPEPNAIIISFYLTASTGLYLMSRQLNNSFTNA